jgi:predicted 2-oxoglutarate/Fe(II)-dependent dioxygenase YbiX
VRELERQIALAAHTAVQVYMSNNRFATVTGDSGYEMLKYQPGNYFREHVDVIQNHPTHAYRRLSVVCYLNDDYKGGELVFTRQELRVTPKAGMIVLFPSGFTHPPSSDDVMEGTKFSLVTWFS